MLNRAENSRGVSLVEVMIALTVLLVVFLGLMQAALLSIEQNMKNLLRD
jgi:prepilin-type N-terminal cleavage/methylation domain-containing protein